MDNINHDKLFKELLTTFFVEFLELFFPSVLEFLDVETISFVDKELFTDVTKSKKKIMDVVALAKFQEQNHTFLIHIENQARNDTEDNPHQTSFKKFTLSSQDSQLSSLV